MKAKQYPGVEQYVSISDSDVFARIVNEEIAEYPVYGIHIKNRSHPIDWYTKCVIEDKPVLPEFYSYKESVVYKQGTVTVSYAVVPIGLQTLLNIVYRDNSPMPLDEVVVDIATIDPALIQRISKLATEHTQKLLDDFAISHGYDNINSAISYYQSAIPAYAADSRRALEVRDVTWSSLFVYMEQVLAGTIPVPKKIAEIEAQLPAMTWTA